MSPNTKKRSLIPAPRDPEIQTFPSGIRVVEPDYTFGLRDNLERFERIYLQEVLKRTSGNIMQGAVWADLDRNTFRRRARKYGLI